MSLLDRKGGPPPVDESWMGTYGDMVTLLLCFFILLAAISKVDTVLFEAVQSGMTKEIGKMPPQRPIESMKREMMDVVAAYDSQNATDVGTDDRGLVLNLDGGTLFQPGSAELKPEIMTLLKEMATTLANVRFENYRIEIQGHTDNVPVATAQFPSNFDLAAARALSTMRALVSFGVPESRILVSSFGAYAPRAPNTLDDGTPLPANQALNRRVSIRVYPR
ncbi:MAG: flagellar motor protein MotB [Pseudomonadota bacterium]